jgi:hypothetical protein
MRAWVAEVCLEHYDRDCGVCDGHDDDLWIDPRDLPHRERPLCHQYRKQAL